MSAQYQAEAPKTITLYYFDATDRGEPIRANFAVGGVKYNDFRVTDDQWSELKPKTPFGFNPVLEVDGQMVGESGACARLSAKIAGLSGRSVFEEALADSVVDTVTEIREGGAAIFKAKTEEEKNAFRTHYNTKVIPGKMAALERFIGDHNGGKEGFFCGGELAWADLFYVVTMEVVTRVLGVTCDEGFPKLKALTASVNADHRVKAYIANRPAKTIVYA